MTPASPRQEEAWRSRAGWVLTGALLAIVFFGYLMPATGYFRAVPGDIGDPRFNSVLLEHLFRVVSGASRGLWNPDFYYPYHGILAFSDNHLGSGATYVLARFAGLSREHAFDLWFGTGVLLNFGCAFYALRRFGASTAAAGIGAFVFACALPALNQDGHAQLVHRFPAPLAALALWQAFERKRLVDLSRVAFFTVWQFYCSIYLGVFLSYFLVAFAVGLLAARRPHVWAQWRTNAAVEPTAIKLGAAGLLTASILALIYLGATYYSVSVAYKLEHWPPAAFIGQMLPRLGSYLLTDESRALAWLGARVEVPMRWEHQMFVGFGTLALVIAAIVAARRGREAVHGLTWPMLIALGLLFLGTLHLGELSLYFLIVDLPGIKSIRAVTRIILIMLVPVSVLAALGADSLWRRVTSPRFAVAVLVGLGALVVIEPLTLKQGTTPIAEWRQRLDTLKARLPADMPKDAILLVRTGTTDITSQVHLEIDAMMLGQELGYPVLNGYSAFGPPGYRLGNSCASAAYRLKLFSQFMGGADIAPYLRRLVVVDVEPCPK